MRSNTKYNVKNKQRGGMVSSPAAYPQGNAWETDGNLPGEGYNTSQTGNFFAFNPNGGALPDPIDTDNFYYLKGGSRKLKKHKRSTKKSKVKRKKTKKRRNIKKRKSRKYMRGGSRDSMFQPLVNGGREIIFGAGDLVNQWQGETSELSPSPTVQNLNVSDVLLINDPPDLSRIQQSAVDNVSNI